MISYHQESLTSLIIVVRSSKITGQKPKAKIPQVVWGLNISIRFLYPIYNHAGHWFAWILSITIWCETTSYIDLKILSFFSTSRFFHSSIPLSDCFQMDLKCTMYFAIVILKRLSADFSLFVFGKPNEGSCCIVICIEPFNINTALYCMPCQQWNYVIFYRGSLIDTTLDGSWHTPCPIWNLYTTLKLILQWNQKSWRLLSNFTVYYVGGTN